MIEPGEIEWRDLVVLLREQIDDGALAPGEWLPSQAELERTHNAGRELVRRAMRYLRYTGVIEMVRGVGYRVPEAREVRTFTPPRGSRGRWRMPTLQEQRELRIRDGVPVLVVTYGGKETVYPGDRWEFTAK